MKKTTLWLEYFRRGLQILVGVKIFDAPLLMKLRILLYVWLFNGTASGTTIHWGVNFYVPHGMEGAHISFGKNLDINHGVEIDYSGGIVIGNDVWFSQNILIETHEHQISQSTKKTWHIKTYPLVIEDDVWIGANVVILPKVGKIGKGAIIGAGSIVTHPVPANAIVAGNPAHIIRMRE